MTYTPPHILEVQAEDHQRCLAQADQLADQGNPLEAQAYYARALRYDPTDYWSWYRHGSISEDLGDYATAFESYHQAAQIRPEDYWAWYGCGYLALEQLQQYTQAVDCFTRAAALRPTDYWAVYRQGEALRRDGQFNAAIACYTRALVLRPEDYWSCYRRGDAYQGWGQLEAAFRDYQAALILRPGDYWSQLQQARVWEQMGQGYRAWGRYRELHLAAPTAEAVQYAWALCCFRLGDRAGMWRHLEPLLRADAAYYRAKLQAEPLFQDLHWQDERTSNQLGDHRGIAPTDNAAPIQSDHES